MANLLPRRHQTGLIRCIAIQAMSQNHPIVAIRMATDFRSGDGFRSLVAITRVLTELLVNPMASIMPAPDLTKNEPSGDRSSGNNDCPKVPDFRPNRLRAPAECLNIIMISCCHLRCRAPSERQSAGLQSLPCARVRRLVGVVALAREIASQDQWETRTVWVPEASIRVALLR